MRPTMRRVSAEVVRVVVAVLHDASLLLKTPLAHTGGKEYTLKKSRTDRTSNKKYTYTDF